jgi:hypothetical protein
MFEECRYLINHEPKMAKKKTAVSAFFPQKNIANVLSDMYYQILRKSCLK